MLSLRVGLFLTLSVFAGSGWYLVRTTIDTHTAKQMTPVIPLPPSNYSFKGMDLVLRDPNFSGSVSDDSSAEEEILHFRQLTSQIKKAKGSAWIELMREAIKSRRLINHFFEDVSAGRIHSRQHKVNIGNQISEGRRSLIGLVTDLSRKVKKPSQKAKLIYAAVRARFLSGNYRSVEKIAKVEKFLPEGLKNRSMFMRGQVGLDRKHRRLIGKSMNGLSGYGKAYANLIIARQLAGLSHNYAQLKKVKKSYRKYLARATRKSVDFSKRLRNEIQTIALNIWIHAERSTNWQKSPVHLNSHKDLLATNAIIERRAIFYVRSRQFAKAISNYRSIGTRVAKKYSEKIDNRILDIQRLLYLASDRSLAYEREILSNLKKYSNRSDQMITQTSHRYRQLAFGLIGRIENEPKNKRLVNEGVKLGMRFSKWTKNGEDRRAIKERIAKIYAANNKHGLAVRIYDDLLKNGPKSRRSVYLNYAIASQMVVASWPKDPPWGKQVTGSKSAKIRLIKYYSQKIGPEDKKPNWHILAHLGLLKSSIGDKSGAFTLWKKGLSSENVSGEHPKRAAGVILLSYHKSKKWQELVSVADICLQKSLRPLGRNLLNVSKYLADGLFYAGKESFARGRFEISWKYLKRFNARFKSDKRRDEGMYVIGQAYHKGGKHRESTSVYVAHTKDYRVSPYRRRVLLDGGRWAMGMAHEEEAMYFYQVFVVENHDKRAIRVRDDLIKLYMGRELYGSAGRLYKEHIKSKLTSVDKKVKSALSYMDLEERYGSRKLAGWGAKKSLELSQDDFVVAEVLAFYARRSAGQGSALKNLLAIEKKLLKLDSSDPRVIDYTGLVRLYIADVLTIKAKEDIRNIFIADHTKALDKSYQRFLKAKSYYDKVCSLGSNSYCAAAMFKLSKMTRFSLDTISEIEIQDTLAKKMVDKFRSRKSEITRHLINISEKSNKKAFLAANRGDTTPEWAQDIIWENTNDWNFEAIQDDNANSFVQWAPENNDK